MKLFKNIKYLSVAAMLLFAFSCEKVAPLKPAAEESVNEPPQSSKMIIGDEEGDKGGGGITDPGNDDDYDNEDTGGDSN